jgi:hypothetical protein
MNKLWYYRRGSEEYGPFSPQELKALAASGQLLSTDDVRKDPSAEWTQAVNVKGLIPAVIATESTSTQWDAYLAKNSEPAVAETSSDTPSPIKKPATSVGDSLDAVKTAKANQGGDTSPADEWYYTQNGQRLGPITVDSLKTLATSGSLGPDDLVWKQGMSGWVVASQIKGLLPAATLAQNVPPPLPAPSSNSQPPAAHAANDPTAWLSSLGSQAASQASAMFKSSNGEVPRPENPNAPKGFAITGLVLGICGAAISIIPCLYLIGIIPDVLGIVFSSLALRKVRAGTGSGRRMAVAGLVCGIIGVLLWFMTMMAVSKSLSDAGDSLRKLDREMDRMRSRF